MDAEGTQGANDKRTLTTNAIRKRHTPNNLCEAEPEVGGKDSFLPPNKRAARPSEAAAERGTEIVAHRAI